MRILVNDSLDIIPSKYFLKPADWDTTRGEYHLLTHGHKSPVNAAGTAARRHSVVGGLDCRQ
ncbi:MAG: hypothetical protein WBL40_05060 [Terrimicrobiaceae bacterium]